MRVTRWKVMAGGLMLAAGGVVAVADGPAPLPTLALPGCQPVPACLPAAPVAVPAPRVAELPAPAPAVLPPLPAPTVVKTEPAPVPRAATGFKFDTGTVVLDKLPPATPTTVLTQPPGPQLVAKRVLLTADGKTVELDANGKPARPDNPLLPPVATAAPKPVPAVPLPDVAAKPQVAEPAAAGGTTLPSPHYLKHQPQYFAPEPAFPLQRELPAAEPVVPAAAPAPAVPAAKPEPLTSEKRLRVVLTMGDDRPRFEVRDGDEVYLKVVSDRVEVKSAADKSDAPTMKAAGKVAFVTPGGDGTCDELAILPGSGQVVAVGNVAFRHTWGRSETTVTAERMTFRLAHPGPTAIQAGYTPVR